MQYTPFRLLGMASKWSRAWSFLRPYGAQMAVIWLFVMLSSLSLLSFPYLAGELLDVALNQSASGTSIREILWYMLAATALQALFSYARMYYSGQLSEKVGLRLKQSTYDQLIRLPMQFYDAQRVGDLLSRLQSDITLIQQGVSNSLAEGLRQIGIIGVGVALIFSIAPQLTVLLLCVLPLFLLMGWYFGRLLRRVSKARQEQQGQSSITAEESLQLITTIKSFTAEPLQSLRYAAEQTKVLRISMRSIKQRSLFIAMMLLLMLGSTSILLAYGAALVEMGTLKTGDLLSFVLYTTFIGGSVASLGDLYAQAQKMRGAADRLEELFEEEPEERYFTQGGGAFEMGDIEFDGLSFCYPTRSEARVLRNLSLNIPRGKRVAIVGPSGSGKTTLTKLLLRYYDPSEGQIRINQRDIKDLSLHELRNEIGIVPQEPILFGGSIGENIRYGRPTASWTEVLEAAKRAYATEFIDRMPDGIDTLIGDQGIKLSGGQRQRIAIARLILKDPSIIILDEATSSLDSASERHVQKALKAITHHRTCLMIAHRLTTIQSADLIYILKEGSIIEQGTHNELLSNINGLYNQLMYLQKVP